MFGLELSIFISLYLLTGLIFGIISCIICYFGVRGIWRDCLKFNENTLKLESYNENDIDKKVNNIGIIIFMIFILFISILYGFYSIIFTLSSLILNWKNLWKKI